MWAVHCRNNGCFQSNMKQVIEKMVICCLATVQATHYTYASASVRDVKGVTDSLAASWYQRRVHHSPALVAVLLQKPGATSWDNCATTAASMGSLQSLRTCRSNGSHASRRRPPLEAGRAACKAMQRIVST